jgi:hypothetical protein
VIVFNDLNAAGMIASRAGVIFHPGAHACIARIEADGVRGGVVFTDYNYTSIQAHMAAVSGRWLTRELLFHAFSYVFNVCGCSNLLALVPEANKKALDLDLHLGFTIQTRIEEVVPSGAMIVLGMRREQCRFLKPVGGSNRQASGTHPQLCGTPIGAAVGGGRRG